MTIWLLRQLCTQPDNEHVLKFYFILTAGQDAFEKANSKTPPGRSILKRWLDNHP